MVTMNLREHYQQQGFLSPFDMLDEDEAAEHRRRLEVAETKIGSLHYLAKVHNVITSTAELASHPREITCLKHN